MFIRRRRAILRRRSATMAIIPRPRRMWCPSAARNSRSNNNALWQRNRLEFSGSGEHRRQRQFFLHPERLVDVAIGRVQRNLQHSRGRELELRRAWTIAITPANTGWGTEVSATWTASPSNATNATYTIYDGTQASGTILGTVVVNQSPSPSGSAVGGSQFQELGVFFPTVTSSGTGTLTVVLNASSANSRVVADAIGSAPAWASTGGPTPFESEPSYQLPFQNTRQRTTPDVAFDASENTGVTSFQSGSLSYGNFGTSLASPCWAGLIAIANQGRVAGGGTTLNSVLDPTQALAGPVQPARQRFSRHHHRLQRIQCRLGLRRNHWPRLADCQSPDPRPGLLRCRDSVRTTGDIAPAARQRRRGQRLRAHSRGRGFLRQRDHQL